LSASNH